MSRCDRFEDALWESAETGQVPEPLARHLETCPRCRQALAAARSALTGFAVLRQAPADSLAATRRAAGWRPVAALAAAACLLLAALLVGLGQRSHPAERVAQPAPAEAIPAPPCRRRPL